MQMHKVRIALYFFLMLVSATLFGLCAARLRYTTHLPPTDPLNGGLPFYDPIAAEMIATAFLTFLWSIIIMIVIARRSERGIVSRFRGELIGLFILWVLYLVGAAFTTSIWGSLKFCWSFLACRILTALVAFAWIGWIVMTFIILITLIFAHTNRSYTGYLHGKYYGPEYEVRQV